MPYNTLSTTQQEYIMADTHVNVSTHTTTTTIQRVSLTQEQLETILRQHFAAKMGTGLEIDFDIGDGYVRTVEIVAKNIIHS